MRRNVSAFLIALSHHAAASAMESSEPPHLGKAGREDYAAFLSAPTHKAFALAPGGGWGWIAGEGSAAQAEAIALARCAENTDQSCVPFAVDGKTVFDAKRWPTLWRLPAARAGDGAIGFLRGATFPDLVFSQADGRPRQLSQWRGRVVVLHFWGSWCGPCRHELPGMAKVARDLTGQGVAFLPLQVRESFVESKRWIDAQKIALPLFDSGAKGSDDGALRVAGGGTLPDRAVAPVFPSTVVLDARGRVAFTHHGPIEKWEEYRPFLRALAR